MKLTEEHLVELGFQLNDISAEESGGDPYRFYTLDLSETNSNFCLISCSNDETENDNWTVEFLETEIKFTHYEHLRDMIFQFNELKRFTKNEQIYGKK